MPLITCFTCKTCPSWSGKGSCWMGRQIFEIKVPNFSPPPLADRKRAKRCLQSRNVMFVIEWRDADPTSSTISTLASSLMRTEFSLPALRDIYWTKAVLELAFRAAIFQLSASCRHIGAVIEVKFLQIGKWILAVTICNFSHLLTPLCVNYRIIKLKVFTGQGLEEVFPPSWYVTNYGPPFWNQGLGSTSNSIFSSRDVTRFTQPARDDFRRPSPALPLLLSQDSLPINQESLLPSIST